MLRLIYDYQPVTVNELAHWQDCSRQAVHDRLKRTVQPHGLITQKMVKKGTTRTRYISLTRRGDLLVESMLRQRPSDR